MVHRQQIPLSRSPTGFSLRAGSQRSAKTSDAGPTEAEIKAAREQQIQQQSEAIQETLNAIQFAVDEYEQRREQSLGELQLIAVELAVMAASHVVHTQLEQGTLGVEQLVASAITRMALNEHATIQLHPQDLDLLKTQFTDRPVPWKDGLISLVADASVERGGIRMETDSGRIVMSDVVSRLSEIRQEWMENINDTTAERRSVPDVAQQMRRFPDRRETA